MTAADLAARIVEGFLVPACRENASDYHALWKHVNRAAGAIAGFVVSFDGELVDRVRLAQHITDDACKLLLAHQPAYSLGNQRMITGDNGLRKRVAECLVEMGA